MEKHLHLFQPTFMTDKLVNEWLDRKWNHSMQLTSLVEETQKSFTINDSGFIGTGYEVNYMKYNTRTEGKNHKVKEKNHKVKDILHEKERTI